MRIRDWAGVTSSIVYGPDDRTRLSETTSRATFTTYAPAGIGREQVARHLDEVAVGLRLVAPDMTAESLEVAPEAPLPRARGTESHRCIQAPGRAARIL